MNTGFDPKGQYVVDTYVVDTSVVYSSIRSYLEEMEGKSAMTRDELIAVRDKCFDIISSLENSFVAIDDEGMIFDEYNKIVFSRYMSEFPTYWFNRMVACDRIKTMEVGSVEKTDLLKAKRRFDLSPTDCQFVFTASVTNIRILLHRDKDYSDASGFINKHYSVKQIHVLKDI